MPIRRISISVPPDLLEKFDFIVREMGFKDRSSAIQAAMRSFISIFEFGRPEGEVVGAIAILFDHTVKGVEDTLTDVQHEYREVISSTIHIHLDEANCLEIIAVRGKADLIKELSRKIGEVKGVKQVRLVVV